VFISLNNYIDMELLSFFRNHNSPFATLEPVEVAFSAALISLLIRGTSTTSRPAPLAVIGRKTLPAMRRSAHDRTISGSLFIKTEFAHRLQTRITEDVSAVGYS